MLEIMRLQYKHAQEVKTRSNAKVTTESQSDRDPETAERKQ